MNKDSKQAEYIKKAGGCIVSKNIIEGKGQLKWLIREESTSPVDNGWRFFSDIDTNDYLEDPNNLLVCDFNTVANIEPAIIGIYLMPVGSDLQLVSENGELCFYDNLTGKKVEINYL